VTRPGLAIAVGDFLESAPAVRFDRLRELVAGLVESPDWSAAMTR